MMILVRCNCWRMVATDLEAIRPRHEQIAEDQLRLVFQGEADPGFAVARLENLPVLPREKFRGRPPAFGVIFD